jgi:TnpA family transposase
MPVDFLTQEQKSRYGQFIDEPNSVQLARYFHLDEADLEFIADRRGDQNRFGVALQLTSVRFLGTFLVNFSKLPINVQSFVGQQLSLCNTVLEDYSQREATKHEHTSLIRRHYGYRNFGEQPWFFRLSRSLYTRSWLSNLFCCP